MFCAQRWLWMLQDAVRTGNPRAVDWFVVSEQLPKTRKKTMFSTSYWDSPLSPMEKSGRSKAGRCKIRSMRESGGTQSPKLSPRFTAKVNRAGSQNNRWNIFTALTCYARWNRLFPSETVRRFGNSFAIKANNSRYFFSSFCGKDVEKYNRFRTNWRNGSFHVTSS